MARCGPPRQIAVRHADVKARQAAVEAAQAQLDNALLQLSYTKVAAPADGYASKLTVHPGQLVTVGQPLIQLVPTTTYVIANFKETQVGQMKVGQAAEIEIDALPGRKFQGKVESLGADCVEKKMTDHHIAKPFTPERLFAGVAEALANARGGGSPEGLAREAG